MKDILGLSTRPKNDDTKRIKKLVRDAWTVPEEVMKWYPNLGATTKTVLMLKR